MLPFFWHTYGSVMGMGKKSKDDGRWLFSENWLDLVEMGLTLSLHSHQLLFVEPPVVLQPPRDSYRNPANDRSQWAGSYFTWVNPDKLTISGQIRGMLLEFTPKIYGKVMGKNIRPHGLEILESWKVMRFHRSQWIQRYQLSSNQHPPAIRTMPAGSLQKLAPLRCLKVFYSKVLLWSNCKSINPRRS